MVRCTLHISQNPDIEPWYCIDIKYNNVNLSNIILKNGRFWYNRREKLLGSTLVDLINEEINLIMIEYERGCYERVIVEDRKYEIIERDRIEPEGRTLGDLNLKNINTNHLKQYNKNMQQRKWIKSEMRKREISKIKFPRHITTNKDIDEIYQRIILRELDE
jgi:hypothetical protein